MLCPSNAIPLIVLGVSNLEARSASPSKLPLVLKLVERVIPVVNVLNPATAVDAFIVNATDEIIAITLPFTINSITG